MLDWSAYRRQLTVRIGEIAKLSPDTIKGYQALSAAGQNTNLRGPKIRIKFNLMVSADCEPTSGARASAINRYVGHVEAPSAATY